MSKKFRAVYDPGDAVITGRFPVSAADIANGAVIDTKLATDAVTPTKIQADAVTTAKIANDAVTSPKAATGVVDGDTITGSVFQTSTPGVGHPTIQLDGPNNLGKFYAGLTGETPGTIDPAAFGGAPAVAIKPGVTASQTEAPLLRLFAGTPGTSEVTLATRTLTVNPSVSSLFVALNGTVDVVAMGAGSVGTGTFRDSVDARVQAIAPAVHVGYRSTAANQTMVTATLTTMNLAGTADHDTGSGFSKASDIVTITTGGIYQLHAFCPFNTNTGNCRNLLRIETWTGSDPGVGLATVIGAAELFGNTIVSNWMNVNAQRAFSSGAKVRVVLYQNQGTNATTQGATTPHQLNIARLS